MGCSGVCWHTARELPARWTSRRCHGLTWASQVLCWVCSVTPLTPSELFRTDCFVMTMICVVGKQHIQSILHNNNIYLWTLFFSSSFWKWITAQITRITRGQCVPDVTVMWFLAVWGYKCIKVRQSRAYQMVIPLPAVLVLWGVSLFTPSVISFVIIIIIIILILKGVHSFPVGNPALDFWYSEFSILRESSLDVIIFSWKMETWSSVFSLAFVNHGSKFQRITVK